MGTYSETTVRITITNALLVYAHTEKPYADTITKNAIHIKILESTFDAMQSNKQPYVWYLIFKLDNSGLLPREGIVRCQSTGAEYRGESDCERGLQWHHDGTEVAEGGTREIRKVSFMAAAGLVLFWLTIILTNTPSIKA